MQAHHFAARSLLLVSDNKNNRKLKEKDAKIQYFHAICVDGQGGKTALQDP